MTSPSQLDLVIPQGKTFSHVLRWDQGIYTFKDFAASGTIVQKAPLRIKTAAAHNMPDGWSFRIANVVGMTQLNSPLDRAFAANYVGRAVSGQPDQIEVIELVGEGDSAYLREVNANGYADYLSGGQLEYALPVDLDTITALRWQARKSFDAPDPSVFDYSLALNVNQSGIVKDNILKTITLQIGATDAAAFTFDSLVHEVEATDSTGKILPFVAGRLTLDREVVR